MPGTTQDAQAVANDGESEELPLESWASTLQARGSMTSGNRLFLGFRRLGEGCATITLGFEVFLTVTDIRT